MPLELPGNRFQAKGAARDMVKKKKNHYENHNSQMVNFETENLIVETEWGWAHVYGVDGNPSCKIPRSSANSTPHPHPLVSRAGAALAHGTSHLSPTPSLGSSVGRKVSITK